MKTQRIPTNPLSRRDLQNAANLLQQVANSTATISLKLDVLMSFGLQVQQNARGEFSLKIQTSDQCLIQALLLELANLHKPDPDELYQDDSIEHEFALLADVLNS